MDNMERTIDVHNKKILQKTTPDADNCNCNKKMQHSCGVTYSIASSYQFQNTTILVNIFQFH